MGWRPFIFCRHRPKGERRRRRGSKRSHPYDEQAPPRIERRRHSAQTATVPSLKNLRENGETGTSLGLSVQIVFSLLLLPFFAIYFTCPFPLTLLRSKRRSSSSLFVPFLLLLVSFPQFAFLAPRRRGKEGNGIPPFFLFFSSVLVSTFFFFWRRKKRKG